MTDKKVKISMLNGVFGYKISLKENVDETFYQENYSMFHTNSSKYFKNTVEKKKKEPEKFELTVNGESKIANQHQLDEISKQIPGINRLNQWEIVYSPNIHGTSLKLLYRKLSDRDATLLLIKDSHEFIFGCYSSHSWEMQKDSNFYGNGECFLFTFNNTQFIRYYPWSEKNQYFMYSNSDGLAMGCGESYGLFIDKSLTKGHSNKCDTFDNLQLSKEQNFKIAEMEVWCMEQQNM